MKLVTATQMKELENLAINEYGIDSLLLMENAARSFCDVLEAEMGGISGKTVGVFCGSGNNGGDGFAIARHLANHGATVTVVAGFSPAKLTKDAKTNFEIITRMGLPVVETHDLAGQRFDVAVDALFGTGFHGEPDEKSAGLIDYMNNRADFVAAVDVPSGISVGDGKKAATAVYANLTITFGLAKLGQFLYPAKENIGDLIVTDISIPQFLAAKFPTPYRSMDGSLLEKLPKRNENSHKGSFGKVLVFGGNSGMSGAPAMAAEAVLKSGAGMVTAAVPKNCAETVAAFCREMMTYALPTESDSLSKTAGERVLEKLKSQDVLVVGCGLGTADSTKKAFLAAVSACEKPMVIDADGINLLKGNINIIKHKKIPVIVTPHPMEFSRISGHSMETVLANKVALSLEFATSNGVVLVLKGADTLVATPEGKLYVCDGANSGMATAGSGDVLSGIIGGMLAQGLEPSLAAALGVYIHNLAGKVARKKKGAYGMTAGDILAAIPDVLQEYSEM